MLLLLELRIYTVPGPLLKTFSQSKNEKSEIDSNLMALSCKFVNMHMYVKHLLSVAVTFWFSPWITLEGGLISA